MKPRSVLFLLLCGTTFSCDRIKELAADAQKKTEEKVAEVTKTAPPATKSTASPAELKLQAMVDQTPEGVIFRKDLPFPTRLEILSVEKLVYRNALTFSSSELGRESARIEGALSNSTTIARSGNRITLTLGKKFITKENPEDPEKPITEVVQDGKAGKSIVLNLKKGTLWQPEAGGDFHSHNWADQIKGHADEMLMETGATSRALWFGKKRLKIGDSVPLSQANLPVIFDTPGTGKVTLVLLSIESLNGHPCGIFSITGDYSTKNHQSIYGSKENTEMTIQSGKVWLSLLYPLVLKKELETIMTSTTNSNGGLSSRVQGSVSLTKELTWKVLE